VRTPACLGLVPEPPQPFLTSSLLYQYRACVCALVLHPFSTRPHSFSARSPLHFPSQPRVTRAIAPAPPADILAEAPKAIKAVVAFAQKTMGVKDVRLTPGLNQAIWSRGVKSPPKRIRVRLERKRNDDEGAKEKLYVVASVVEGVTSFKVGLGFKWCRRQRRVVMSPLPGPDTFTIPFRPNSLATLPFV
jgi:ribosomal protein L31E